MSALRSEQQIAPSELFFSAATQGTDLGARFTTGDGRVYRYVQGTNTAFVAGKLYQTIPQDTTNFQSLGVSVAAGTLTTAVTTGSSVTLFANECAGGLLTVRSGSGAGFGYKIKSHPSVTTGTLTFQLEDPLQVGLLATSVIDVTPSPYTGVVVQATTATAIPIGVAVNNTTGSNFGWVQTRGICNVLCAGTAAVATNVSASTTVAGAVQSSTGSQPIVGYMMVTGVNAVNLPVFLTIE